MPTATRIVSPAKARALGVDERVTIIARHVSGADKEALFAAARLFAMTSLSENFGIAAFEAMRRGVPVLATPDVGMSEIVRDAQAGLVVDPTPACALPPGLRDACSPIRNAAAARGRGGPAPCHRSLRLARRRPPHGGALSVGRQVGRKGRPPRDGAAWSRARSISAKDRRVVIIADWSPPDFGAVGPVHADARAGAGRAGATP